MKWHSATHLQPPLFYPSLFLALSFSDGLYVVSGQHSLLAGALNSPIHPTLIDLLHVHDYITVQERHLIFISRGVVIHGSVALLKHVHMRLM